MEHVCRLPAGPHARSLSGEVRQVGRRTPLDHGVTMRRSNRARLLEKHARPIEITRAPANDQHASPFESSPRREELHPAPVGKLCRLFEMGLCVLVAAQDRGQPSEGQGDWKKPSVPMNGTCS